MPEYTSEQKRVIAHREGNLLVSAAAGSGKTAVLVERILALVREGADIASFLIVTFTRAAADELRQRLMSKLEEAAEEDDNLQEQVGRVELASISTIHAFCLQLIGRYFEKANAEPNARTCTEAERIILQMRAMDKVLDEMYEDDEKLIVLEKMGDPEQVRLNAESLYRFLMCQPDPMGWLDAALAQYSAEKGNLDKTDWFAHAQELEGTGMLAALGLARAALRFCCESYADDCRAMEALIASDCMEMELFISGEKEAAEFVRWKSPLKKGATPSDDLKSLQDQRETYRERFKNALKTRLTVNEWDEEKYAAMEAPLYALAEVTRAFMKEYAALKRENGVMDYNDLEQITLKLTRDESVCEDLKQKYRYIFVDEYQDSSAVQEAILSRISRGDNVFHVGDVKQSIYGFRQSEPGLFLKEQQRYAAGEGGQLIALNRNFRSLGNVLHCTNRIFSRCMDMDSAGMVYDENAALYPGRNSGEAPDPVTIVQIIDRKPGKEEQEGEQVHSEIEAVARLIKSFVGTPVADKDGTVRPARYGDIVVLRRAVMSVLPQYMEHFGRCGIPVYAGKGGNFYETPEIRQVMDYLWAVHNPLEDVHLLGALRGVGEFTAQELADIRLHGRGKEGSGEHKRMWTCLTEYIRQGENERLRKRAEAFAQRLVQLSALSREASLAQLCSAVLEETGLISRFAALPKGRVRAANLRSLPVRAAEYDAAGLRLGDFLRRIASTAARNREEDVPAFSDNDDVVRIMTVHQSKGLEFPIVIGAGLGAAFRISNDTSSDGFMTSRVWCERENGIALEYCDPDEAALDKTVKTRALAAIKKQASVAEEMRILYVLMTRARERLALVGEVKGLADQMEKWQGGFYDIRCMLDWIMPVVLTHPDGRALREKYGWELPEEPDESRWEIRVTMETEETEETAKEEIAIPEETGRAGDELLQQLQYIYPHPEPTVMQKASVSELAHGAQESFFVRKKPAFLSREKKLTGAARGSALHRFMEIVDFDALRNCTDREAELTRQVQQAAQLNRMTSEEADAVLGGLEEIKRFLESTIGRRILAGAKILREKPFEIRMDEGGQMRLVQGVIDLMVLEEDGAVLVDYKTDHTGLDPESVRQKHGMQVALYRKAAGLAGITVKKSLVYLFYTGEAIEIN